ncbi:MAG: hypothetical protein LUD16_05150 [Lachnospiraceae bacterium]|nr:hypothetical protein [Lachnospiraceae bacterium]
MRENVRKFLELLETDPDLKQRAEELGRKEAEEGIPDLIALAAACQISLTERDFRLEEPELMSDEELDVVSGGLESTSPLGCVCALPGNGNGGLCSCISNGEGTTGCSCTLGGVGN